jgi:uncharacterized phiE125 gp8 family phage protein
MRAFVCWLLNIKAIMATRSITPPASEPVELAEMKTQLGVTHTQHDAIIGSFISAAREECEQILGRSLLPQTWENVLPCFPPGAIKLFWPSIIAVSSIKYIDASTANETTLPADQYYLDKHNEPGLITRAQGVSWPATLDVTNAVRVTYTAGYADAATVPASIKNWIKLAVEHMYDRCDSDESTKIPDGFCGGLLDRYRIWSL